MEFLYLDSDIIVCIKPQRVLSTDEPGGVPELARAELCDSKADVRTVHRLDRVVGGVMLLARNASAASILSAQLREGEFQKRYLAVCHGICAERGDMRDLLRRDKARKMTFVAEEAAKGVQEARLSFERLGAAGDMSLVRVELHTGRTHQIRCQFASRGMALVGDRKYGSGEDECEIALWSEQIGFTHPVSGEKMSFSANPPKIYPWNDFNIL